MKNANTWTPEQRTQHLAEAHEAMVALARDTLARDLARIEARDAEAAREAAREARARDRYGLFCGR